MDSTIATYIANEEAKIKALREEAASRERKLEVFRSAAMSMQGPDVIDLNARVRPAQQAQIEIPAVSEQAPSSAASSPKKKGVKAVILAALSRQPQPLRNIVASLVAQGHGWTYDHIRTELWTMKKAELVLSPELGMYQLSDKGESYLQSL